MKQHRLTALGPALVLSILAGTTACSAFAQGQSERGTVAARQPELSDARQLDQAKAPLLKNVDTKLQVFSNAQACVQVAINRGQLPECHRHEYEMTHPLHELGAGAEDGKHGRTQGPS